jgi:hypothetical protein
VYIKNSGIFYISNWLPVKKIRDVPVSSSYLFFTSCYFYCSGMQISGISFFYHRDTNTDGDTVTDRDTDKDTDVNMDMDTDMNMDKDKYRTRTGHLQDTYRDTDRDKVTAMNMEKVMN